jgi:DNA-binding response OmpR family regulator
MRLLIVEDDAPLASGLQRILEAEGHAVDVTPRGEEAVLAAAHEKFDLVILDIGLPQMDGFEVLRRLRTGSDKSGPTPVLVLTARDAVEDRVRGLDLGADDYMGKPFSPIEVAARVESLLRRAPASAPTPDLLVFDEGRLEIDTGRREVRVDSALRAVTRSEYELLLALAEHQGRVLSRAKIARRLRADRGGGGVHVVDVHVRNLRRKIEDDPGRPRWIETIRGHGYRIGLAAA